MVSRALGKLADATGDNVFHQMLSDKSSNAIRWEAIDIRLEHIAIVTESL